jgi:hypothetical protein
MKSCLTAQIRFMLFKGPGPFKNNFKIGGNIDELKAYGLIPLTPPLFFHFTLPLKKYSFRGESSYQNHFIFLCSSYYESYFLPNNWATDGRRRKKLTKYTCLMYPNHTWKETDRGNVILVLLYSILV